MEEETFRYQLYKYQNIQVAQFADKKKFANKDVCVADR
jgi:hypothetical protein